MDTIAIEGYINFCKDFDSDDESEKLKAYETYNNYFDILDGCFEAFNIDEGKFSIATELFGGKGFNIFKIVRDAILSAWNWFCRKLKDIKEMIFGSKKKSTQSAEPKSEDLQNEINKKDKEIEELKKQLRDSEFKNNVDRDHFELNRKSQDDYIKAQDAQIKQQYETEDMLKQESEYLKHNLREIQTKYDNLLRLHNGSTDLRSLMEERDKLKSELERVNGAYERLKESQNNSSTAYNGNDNLKKRIKELEEEKLDLLAELKEEKNNERTDQILIREISKRINQAYDYLTQMITMLFSKIKKSKNLVDDLADGVDISTDKDFTYVTTLNSEYRDLRDKCIEIIIEIEGLASGKLNNTAVLNSHVIRISKYISDIEKNVEKSKNELISYIDSIERKRISEDKMPLVQKMLETIENMFTQIQSMCIQLMTVRIKEDKEEKNIIKPYIKLRAL